MLVPRPMLHEIGVTRSGEPVVQTPAPGQGIVGEEIQLQIVLGANKTSSDSPGTPRWRGWCSWPLRQIGNSTSYVYRRFAESERPCVISLQAEQSPGTIYWSETYHVQVRK